MMEMMAERFPGCFSGYSLAVAESHQRTKVDTSGTAKAVVASLNKMGLQFGEVGGVGWGWGWGGGAGVPAARCSLAAGLQGLLAGFVAPTTHDRSYLP